MSKKSKRCLDCKKCNNGKVDKMFRIKQYPKGYVVEIQKRKWYGKKYWTHFISVAGIESKPWHFSSFGYAVEGLMDEIVRQVINNK